MNDQMFLLQGMLILIMGTGTGIGFLSLFWPLQSIQLYQWIMKIFNWKVEPIDLKRELSTTRVLGFIAMVLSLLIFVVMRYVNG